MEVSIDLSLEDPPLEHCDEVYESHVNRGPPLDVGLDDEILQSGEVVWKDSVNSKETCQHSSLTRGNSTLPRSQGASKKAGTSPNARHQKNTNEPDLEEPPNCASTEGQAPVPPSKTTDTRLSLEAPKVVGGNEGTDNLCTQGSRDDRNNGHTNGGSTKNHEGNNDRSSCDSSSNSSSTESARSAPADCCFPMSSMGAFSIDTDDQLTVNTAKKLGGTVVKNSRI